MDVVIRFYVTCAALVRDTADRAGRDRGQASTEYAGILFVVVAIMTALIAIGFSDVGAAIKGKITEAIGKLGA